MRAIILAAGTGSRLSIVHNKPKVLLEFNNKTLLERHIQNLYHYHIKKITVVVGYQSHLIINKIESLGVEHIEVVTNSNFSAGSILSMFLALNQAEKTEDILLMDGDVLYDKKILETLIHNKKSALVYDTEFDDDEEPVKVCITNKQVQEFGKGIFSLEQFSEVGESVGFFKINSADTVKLKDVCNKMVTKKETERPHEDAFSYIIKNKLLEIEPLDVTGLPWTEIDFPEDIARAKSQILKTLEPQ